MQNFIYEHDPTTQEMILEEIEQEENVSFRISYFEHDFFSFCCYYFENAFTHSIEEFHQEWFKICVMDMNALIIAFRGSAKTAIVAYMYIVYCLCYKLEDYILFLAYKEEDAKDKLVNIITALKTNKRIVKDFGYLYENESSRKRKLNKRRQQTTMSKFVTTNGIKVQAISLRKSARGLQMADEEGNIHRPSLVVGDDIDVNDSVKNETVIEKNYDLITGELFGAVKGRCLFLGNVIGEDGVNIRLRNDYAKKSAAWVYSEKALIENGEIVWKDRFVETIEEKNRLNAKLPKRLHKIAVEELRTGRMFEPNYLNLPALFAGNPVFNGENIMKLKVLKPYKTYKVTIDDRTTELHIYSKDFSMSSYQYVYAGMDFAGGQGGDSDAFDMTMLDKKGKLFARTSTNIFDYKHAKKFVDILFKNFKITFIKGGLGPEVNFYGESFITELEQSRHIYKTLYVPKTSAKQKTKYTRNVGWRTSGPSKEQLVTDLSHGINKGLLEVDPHVQKEMRGYVMATENGKIVYTNDKMICGHDDSVISYGIAFQMFLKNNPGFLKSK